MTIRIISDHEVALQMKIDAQGKALQKAMNEAIALKAESHTLRQQLAEAQALIEVQMSNVKIPEPIGTICFDGGRWEQNWVSSQDAYSEEQLKQYGDDRAREVLDRAAKTITSTYGGVTAVMCANLVLKLKEQIK